MSGDVWEWCSDWYYDSRNMLVSYRGNYSPDNRYSNIGLRFAL